jgi:hypothetical protein
MVIKSLIGFILMVVKSPRPAPARPCAARRRRPAPGRRLRAGRIPISEINNFQHSFESACLSVSGGSIPTASSDLI